MPLTAQGFEIATQEEITDAIGVDQRGTIDAALVLDDDDPLYQANFIVADQLSDTSSAIAVAYNSVNRDAAEDIQLDNIGKLIGIKRLEAQGPRVSIRMNLTAGAAVTLGDQIYPTGFPARTWAALDTFTAPVSGVYVRTFEATEGTPAVGSGVTWAFPTITGWNSLTNPLPSEPARLRETNEQYRARQDTSNARPGAGSLDALADDLGALPGVLQADVVENTRSYDVAGAPPHSFEALIFDGTIPQASDNEIAQTIWDGKPPGIGPFGLTSGIAVDAKGNPHTIPFSRVASVRMVVSFTIQVLPGWQDTQLAAIRTKILDSVLTRRSGEDFVPNKIKGIATAANYTYDVIGYTQGPIGGPYVDAITSISRREIASLADADLTIGVQKLSAPP